MELFRLFGSINIDLSDFENALDAVNQGAQNIQQNMQNLGNGMKDVGANMTAGVSAPLLGVGAAAANAAIDAENAMVQIANATATSTVEAEKLTEAARNIYKEGYGESLEDVSAALVQVKNNMKLLDDSEIEQATESAMILAKTLEVEVSEVTRGAHGLMTGFGIEAKEAFDKIAGATDLNFSGDLMDQMAEFSHIAASAGYSLDEYFEQLRRGSEAGIYNMDRINNAILEFDLRANDIGASEDVFSQLSDSTNELWQAMLNGKGSSKEVAESVIRDLQAMDDQTAANQLGIALFGTVWEDNSRATMYQLYDTNAALKDTAKTMDDLAEASEETFSQKWLSFLRIAQDALIPIGTILLDLGTKYLPIVAGWIEKLANAFAALPEGMQTTIVVSGILTALLGPMIMMLGMLITSVSSIVGVFGKIAGAFRATSTAATGIINTLGNLGNSTGGAASGFARILPILGRVGGALLRFVPIIGTVLTAFSILKMIFKTFGGDTINGFIAGVNEKIEAAKAAITNIANRIATAFREFFGIASPSKLFIQFGRWIIEGLINGVKSLVGAVLGLFSSIFTRLKNIALTGINAIVSFTTKGFNLLASGARKAGGAIVSAISGALSQAMGAAKSAASKAFKVGSDIVGGIANGIRSGVKKATSAISSISSSIMNRFKKDNGIKSPARRYITEAAHLPGGIAGGITSGVSVVTGAMTGLVKSTATAFAKAREKMPLNLEPESSISRFLKPSFGAAIQGLDSAKNLGDHLAFEEFDVRARNKMREFQSESGFINNGGIHIHVQEVTDLTPQQLQNDVTNRFFPNARSKQ